MKRFIALFVLFFSVHANAALVKIEVGSDFVAPGDAVDVTLIAEDLINFDSFDFDFNFDSSLFAFNNDVTSDLTIGFPGLSVLEGPGPGEVAFSFLDFAAYTGPGTFTLAKFSLTGLNGVAGTGSFNITEALFGEFFTGEIEVDTSSSASVDVSAPPALSLFAAFALVMLGLRKRRESY